MINLELPKKLLGMQQMSHQLASGVFRPISRKYDRIEHGETPAELLPAAHMMAMARAQQGPGGKGGASEGVRNGANMQGVLGVEEMSWGDIGLMLSVPNGGLGNAAIIAVGTAEQN